MAEEPSKVLSTLISAAAVLSGSEHKTQSPDLVTVLKSRLVHAREILQTDKHDNVSGSSLQVIQYITAKESLHLLERMQSLFDPDDGLPSGSGSGSSPPLLGTRDLSYVRTLLSVIFKWGVTPLMAELELNLPYRQVHGSLMSGEPRIIDLTERPLDFEELPVMTLRLLGLLFGPTKVYQTWITTSILNQHAVDLLTPCLVVGWAPSSVSGISTSLSRHSKDVKSLTIRFLNVLRTHESITALGMILSSSSISAILRSFPHVSRACRYLLSKQLYRPDGVRGLCTSMFGDEEEGDVAPLDKLEHASKVLGTVPASTDAQEYYQSMIPRVLTILLPLSPSQQQSPQIHKRAAAFTLSRMLSASSQHRALTSGILLPLLHHPFILPTTVQKSGPTVSPSQSTSQSTLHLTPLEALQTIQTFMLHADPSPAELSTLLTPIVPELYALASLCRSSKTADPNVRESLNALLSTWGRIVSSSDAIDGLWSIITGSGGYWELGLDGFIRSSRPTPPPSISLLAAADIEATSHDEVDINANPFNLRPDPSEFVSFVKKLDRKDVSPEIFTRLLNDYRELNDGEDQPIRTLLYLQLILQMQSQLSTTVLSKPEHVLSFINHALGSAPSSVNHATVKPAFKKGLGLKDLRIVEESVPEANDSDDEEGDERADEAGGGKDEIFVTAITLLLSVLEANPDLSPHNALHLGDIFTSLEQLTSHASTTIRQLAREARLVLMSRMASTSAAAAATASRSTTTTETESPHATYQKALKLLQDPIIPIRAHGLQLLRELVARRSRSVAPQPEGTPPPSQTRRPAGTHGSEWLDAALMPGILSIFLQSIQDDESYIFLNAVQGLAAMVDGYGKEVLRGIVEVYLSGTGVGGSGVAGSSSGGTVMTKQELDARIRVGEALNVVVKRCGEALGLYVDILVPPLLTILQSSYFPTTLRTSALSILAQCVATNALALNAYTPRLAYSCVELIQLESVAVKHAPAKSKYNNDESSSTTKQDNDDKTDEDHTGGPKRPARAPDLMDSNPTTTNTKAAPLRRTALHFLSQLVRAHIASLYDARATPMVIPSVTLNVGGSRMTGTEMREEVIPAALLRRAGVVLGYVAATDEDGVARVMAREASELVEQYKEASLGF